MDKEENGKKHKDDSKGIETMLPKPTSPAKHSSMVQVNLSPMETKLLRDIKAEFRNVARTRYASPIDLRLWLIKHQYPEDFIEAACSI